MLAEGRVVKEIGSILQMTTRTVAYHKYRIMEVIGVRNGADLVKYAVRNHVVGAWTVPTSHVMADRSDSNTNWDA